MLNNLRELWKFRELLIILVRRDLKIRYKNSVLGFGWSLLNPLAQVLTITLVLKFLGAQGVTENYHAYVFCALLPWLFFSTATMDAGMSLVAFHDLLRRAYFPREALPLTTVAANFIHFLLAMGVFLVYETLNPLFWWVVDGKFNFPIQPTVVLTVIPMAGLFLLVSGIAMFISVWTLYFEDVRYLADSGMKILYWLVPVLYFPELILHRDPGGRGELIYTLYMLNPLSAFITSFKKLTLPPTKSPGGEWMTTPMGAQDWGFLGIAMVVSLVFFLLAHRYFNARKWKLAER
ncbi:MAG: ABC transporter permease [Armatimonadota bacterium]